MGVGPATSAYPDRPIRLLVSFPPGGSSDAMARIVQPGVEKLLGQPVVIENRPGAGGMIAIDAVAKAAPDGYVLGLGGAGALGTNLGLQEKMSYDPRKDVAPVTGLAGSPFILAAAPSFQGKSLHDVIAQAKGRADKLAIGHGGNGTLMHLTAEMFNQMAGTKVALVPYRGIAPVVNDLIGGHVALGVIDPPSGHVGDRGRQDQDGRDLVGQALSPPARHPDLRGVGPAGFRIDRLVRHRGTGRHAGRRDRDAQCRLRQGAQGSRISSSASARSAPSRSR